MIAEHEKPDFVLIEEFKNGKNNAFNELVRRYETKIYFVIKRIVENHDDTNDVMQDVFIKVYHSLSNFRGESNFYTWLYRISCNFSINFVRAKKVRKFFNYDDLIIPLVSSDPKPDEKLETEDKKSMIDKAINSLPKMQKLTFIMRYYDEMTYEEISQVLKKSVGALKANYFHAFKKIEEYIKDEMPRD